MTRLIAAQSAGTLFLDSGEVVRLVRRKTLPACLRGIANCIESDFSRWESFDKSARVAAHSPQGVIELMPVADASHFAFKYVNGHPGNARVGLPTVMAFGVLADVVTGLPLLLADMTLLTAIRTAAMSAVAARRLARRNSRSMALIGNGAQSEFQALAFRDLVGISELRLFDVDPAATAKLTANLAGQRLLVRHAVSVADAVRGADIVTTLTADKTRAAVITADMVEPGMYFNAVGGDCPGKTELASGVLERATVFVEYAPQSRVEGDVQQMPADFPVTELWQVLAGHQPGRTSDEQVIVFDSVGFALEDYSALRFLFDTAAELGLGRPVSLVARTGNPRNLFGLLGESPSLARIGAATRVPEPQVVMPLLDGARLPSADALACEALALRLARGVREHAGGLGRSGLVQGLLQEFSLSSQEGVALMCMAEALLRVPDVATRDALIRDKLGHADWAAHLGHSRSMFVNAAAWGLMLTGRLVATHSEAGMRAALRRALGRGGEPLVRLAVDRAMRMMGEQFVMGETIDAALGLAPAREAQGFRFSYDMLGEAALTDDDAQQYLAAYEAAIHAIGRAGAGRGLYDGPGISIKLSALHPRYSRAQVHRVFGELYPRLRRLALLAREQGIGINLDAEESDRLMLSLELLERLCEEPALEGWQGIGFVVQAYQKRCPLVVDRLVALGRRSGHRLMVRLVKGAYWDSEIKRAQQDGLADYPVYTRKAHTDVAYLACARRLLAAPDAVFPQFATHNAHTLAAIHQMAGEDFKVGQYEFQCLFGMGEPLYEQVVSAPADGGLGRPCRIYAPVGTHQALLAYLVRRLLENGANSSFVNRIADPAVSLADLVEDPVRTVERAAQQDGALALAHPKVVLPECLYGQARRNSSGCDLADEATLAMLAAALDAQPPVARVECESTPAQVMSALAQADEQAPAWAATPAATRATMLRSAADRLQADLPALVAVLVREAGKTLPAAVAEVREAVDFLRYDAASIDQGWDDAGAQPLGPTLCISPWNFPLAIFIGQVAAALAAGNTVLAKPAEQTPTIAALAVAALHAAGVPAHALHCLPGQGETVGAMLVADPRVQAVLFTGSTEVARVLQITLAERLDRQGQPVTLVAETGGQNAMIVDSSALAEQVVADVLASAFDSAGQRCSALRLLCVQHEVADRIHDMLVGAMRELSLGDPVRLATDIGPVIDGAAQDGIVRHVEAMRTAGHRVMQPAAAGADPAVPTLVAPTLIDIDSPAQLQREVFGPVLHFLRYQRDQLPQLLQAIARTGYGLTMGVHSRVDETILQVLTGAQAGNLYVNRNIVGAVVGVQPFGGEGLSGTGPKAGGPLYLLRLLRSRPAAALRQAIAAAAAPGFRDEAAPPLPSLLPVLSAPASGAASPLSLLAAWATAGGNPGLADDCAWLATVAPDRVWTTLAGPTGELNVYGLLPRQPVLCVADDDADRLTQLAAVLAVGGQALWPASAAPLRASLPAPVQALIEPSVDWTTRAVGPGAVLFAGEDDALTTLCRLLARLPGPIVGVTRLVAGQREVAIERLVSERSISINTAAAGGNASLMSIG